jgi:outer membrane protein assembly factor BamA
VGADVRDGVAVLVCTIVLWTSPAMVAQQERIVAIQVHGNTLTPDAEIVLASGLSEGAVFSDDLIAQATARLKTTKRFDRIEVLKRYASISDATQIVIVIQVDEGPVRIALPVPGVPDVPGVPGQSPRVVKRGPVNIMFVPRLDAEDGYGLTYGAQMAVTGHRNTSSRLVVPLSWGGDKRAAAEFQKEFAPRFAPQLKAGALVQRRTHPFFKEHADRKRLWGRAEWQLAKPLRAGGTLAWQKASLLDRDDTTRSIGADLVLDTRLDPVMPRNAVYARAAVDRLAFSGRAIGDRAIVKTELEGNGYIGLFRGNVLAVRALREDMNRSAPPYFKSILGGSRNLRGFRAGYGVGDTLMAGSVELRMPLTSPLNIARFGTSVFLDAATAYDKGQKFRDQHVRKGVGAGLWASAALFRISLMVAHGIGEGNRVHFGAGLTF